VWAGVARGRLRAAQWALLLLPLYVGEGIVRAWSETGRHAVCAVTGTALALTAIASGIAWVRNARRATADV